MGRKKKSGDRHPGGQLKRGQDGITAGPAGSALGPTG